MPPLKIFKKVFKNLLTYSKEYDTIRLSDGAADAARTQYKEVKIMAQQIISLETITKNTIWVAKMQGYREVGTKDEIGDLFYDEDCRDFDISCEQPDELKPFYDAYFAYNREHGWITIPEFYKDIYLVDIQQEQEAAEKPQKTPRRWTEDEIRNLIQSNDKILYNGFLKLYERQTATEQANGETRERNGQGFNALDANFLTSCAEFLKKRGYLSDKQKYHVRKKLIKYNRQLTEIANEGR